MANPCKVNISICFANKGHRIIQIVRPRCVRNLVNIFGTSTRNNVEEEISVRIELRDIRILNYLCVSQLSCTPHEELSIQTPICMHDMKQTVRMLTYHAQTTRHTRDARGQQISSTVLG